MKGAELSVITGCMFSGKTAEMARQVERARFAGINSVILKPHIDIRYGKPNHIVSHNGVECQAVVVPVDRPTAILEAIQPETGLVAIDEVQFFPPEIVMVVKKLLLRDIQVLVAGLPLDFRAESFGSMPTLLAMADRITLLTAICTYKNGEKVCGREATRTQRFIDGEPADYNDPIVLIGGTNSYAARCSRHHLVPRQTGTLGPNDNR